MLSPALPYPSEVADLVRLSEETALEANTVTEDGAEVAVAPCWSVPLAVAVLVTEPASTSAWVTV